MTTIICAAPDETTAADILTQTQRYLAGESAAIPWFAWGEADAGGLRRDYARYLAREAAERQWEAENQAYIIAITHRAEVAFQRGNTAGGHAVLKEWHDKKAADLGEPLPAARAREIRRLADAAAVKGGSIERDGLRLVFRQMRPESAVAAVSAWLAGQGCRDIRVEPA